MNRTLAHDIKYLTDHISKYAFVYTRIVHTEFLNDLSRGHWNTNFDTQLAEFPLTREQWPSIRTSLIQYLESVPVQQTGGAPIPQQLRHGLSAAIPSSSAQPIGRKTNNLLANIVGSELYTAATTASTSVPTSGTHLQHKMSEPIKDDSQTILEGVLDEMNAINAEVQNILTAPSQARTAALSSLNQISTSTAPHTSPPSTGTTSNAIASNMTQGEGDDLPIAGFIRRNWGTPVTTPTTTYNLQQCRNLIEYITLHDRIYLYILYIIPQKLSLWSYFGQPILHSPECKKSDSCMRIPIILAQLSFIKSHPAYVTLEALIMMQIRIETSRYGKTDNIRMSWPKNIEVIYIELLRYYQRIVHILVEVVDIVNMDKSPFHLSLRKLEMVADKLHIAIHKIERLVLKSLYKLVSVGIGLDRSRPRLKK